MFYSMLSPPPSATFSSPDGGIDSRRASDSTKVVSTRTSCDIGSSLTLPQAGLSTKSSSATLVSPYKSKDGLIEVMVQDIGSWPDLASSPTSTAHDQSFKDEKADAKHYEIEKTAKYDDEQLLTPFTRFMKHIAPIFTVFSLLAYWMYFGFRIYFLIKAQHETHRLRIIAWLYVSAEVCIALPAIFHEQFLMFAARWRRRPQLRLRGNNVPTVDVIVTTCKEDVDSVLDTVRACCVLDWPEDRFRILVSDDGADPGLKAGVLALSKLYPNLYYHARVKVKGKPHHFKAGNLISATETLDNMPGGGAEFIAALDADMIPEQIWLRAIMAHMLNDDQVALTCPQQCYYNVPRDDPLAQSLSKFINVVESIKDANGVAWCTGSGYAIRRSALDAIGGWPVGSIAEDVYTSSMLLGKGYKTVYVHEELQWGTVPDTMIGHLKQRTRWSLGTLQTASKLNYCLWGPVTKHMTFRQRASGWIFSIDVFFNIALLLAILMVPIALASGSLMVAYAVPSDLLWQIRFCFIALICQDIESWLGYIPAGFRRSQRESLASIWMSFYHADTVIRCHFLPKWLGGRDMAFTASGSLKDQLNERCKAERAPLWRRLKVIIWDCNAWVHLSYITFLITAVILSSTRAKGTDNVFFYLLTHAFWPPMLWIWTCTAYGVPIYYAIFPPTVPDREEMLDRDPKTGVARPKLEWKRPRYGVVTHISECLYFTRSIYTIVMFVGTFTFLPGIIPAATVVS